MLMHTVAHKWTSEDSLCEDVISFYHVCPQDRTQVFLLGSKGLYLPSHFASIGLCNHSIFLYNIKSPYLVTCTLVDFFFNYLSNGKYFTDILQMVQ